MASPESGGGRQQRPERPARAAPAPKSGVPIALARWGGAGPERQWRSRAQPGLPGSRAGLAGSAAHSRATGRGHNNAAAHAASIDRRRAPPAPTRTGPRAAQPDQRRRVGLRAGQAALVARRETGRAARLQSASARGPRSGAAPCRKPASAVRVLSPLHWGRRPAPARAIRSSPQGRDPPGLGGEGHARAIERGRAGPPREAPGRPFRRRAGQRQPGKRASGDDRPTRDCWARPRLAGRRPVRPTPPQARRCGSRRPRSPTDRSPHRSARRRPCAQNSGRPAARRAGGSIW